MSGKRQNTEKSKPSDTKLRFPGLEFEEVLEDLLKIKPVENVDLKPPKAKKKGKPKK